MKKEYKKNIPVIADEMIGLSSTTDFTKALENMYGDENIIMKTDLSAKQICKLNIIWQMAVHYDVQLLKDLSLRFVGLRVSKDRLGRGEAVQLTQGILGMKRLEGIEKMIEGGFKK